MSPKAKKAKTVSYELIAPESEAGERMYPLMEEIINEHHEDIRDARIALAWCTSWNTDKDGRLTLGKCKKASDLDRELAPFDFVIMLLRSFWEDGDVTDAQRKALLDHELCHAAVAHDPETGEPLYDERDRQVFRIRKHDIEEFGCIVQRHGLYKRDLERFAQSIELGKRNPLLKAIEELRPKAGSGIDSVSFGVTGGPMATLHSDGRTTVDPSPLKKAH